MAVTGVISEILRIHSMPNTCQRTVRGEALAHHHGAVARVAEGKSRC